MDFLKKVKPADILMFCYIFFISCIKLGVNIYYYAFTLSDILLAGLLFFYIYRLLRRRVVLDKVFRNFLVFYLVFLAGLLFSFLHAQQVYFCCIELMPYIYTGLLLLAVFLYISDRNISGLKVIENGFIISFLLIVLAGIVSLFLPPLYRILFDTNAAKFLFFTRMPNQLSAFFIVAFALYLIKSQPWNNVPRFQIAWDIIISLFLLIGEYLTQSKTGMSLSLLLVIYFYIKKVDLSYIRRKPLNSLMYFFLVCSIVTTLYGGILILNKVYKMSLLESRPLTAIQNMIVLDDFRKEQFSLAFHTFLQKPVNGIGLGNFRFTHPSHSYEIHNSFLSILTETGVVGFLPFCALFGYMIFLVLKYKIKNKLDYFIILFSIFVFAFQHHIFRERWIWAFLAYFMSHVVWQYRNSTK